MPKDQNPELVRRRYWYIGVASVALLTLVFGTGPAYRAFKLWRAESLSEQAIAYLEDDAIAEAKERIAAAHQLAPQNRQVLLALARILAELKDPMALSVWNDLAQRGDLDEASRRLYARMAQRFGDSERALKVVRPLVERENPKEEDVLLSQEIALAAGRLNFIEQMKERFPGATYESAEAKLNQAQSWLAVGDAEHRDKALTLLRSLGEEAGGVGLRALTLVAANSRMPTEARLEAVNAIILREDVSRELYLEAQSARMDLLPSVREEVIQAVIERFATGEMEELTLLGRWLNRENAHENVLELITPELAHQRKDLFAIRMDALAEMERWEHILNVLTDEVSLPIPDFHRQLYLFRAHMELENPGDAQFRWDTALLPGNDLQQRLEYAGTYAERMGYYDYARRAYSRLSKNPATAIFGYASLMRVSRQLDDVEEIVRLLEEMQETFPHDKAVQNDLNYYRLLLGREVSQSLVSARDLYESKPSMMAYRIHFAFALLRMGHAEKAAILLDISDLNWSQLRNQWQYIKYLTLLSNGEREQARQLAMTLDQDALLSEEKALLEEM